MKTQRKIRRQTLKVWNGRGHGIYDDKHISVAAYSKKHAAEIIGIACKTNVSINEMNVYYAACWGNSMKDIHPTEPCVYINEDYSGTKPIRVY